MRWDSDSHLRGVKQRRFDRLTYAPTRFGLPCGWRDVLTRDTVTSAIFLSALTVLASLRRFHSSYHAMRLPCGDLKKRCGDTGNLMRTCTFQDAKYHFLKCEPALFSILGLRDCIFQAAKAHLCGGSEPPKAFFDFLSAIYWRLLSAVGQFYCASATVGGRVFFQST